VGEAVKSKRGRCVYCGRHVVNITRDHPIPQVIARHCDKLFKSQAITVSACDVCNKRKDYVDREVALIVNQCDQGLSLTPSFQAQLHPASMERILSGQPCWIRDPILFNHLVKIPIDWNNISTFAEFVAMGLLAHHTKIVDASSQVFPQRDVSGRTPDGIQHIHELVGLFQSVVPTGQDFTFYSDGGRYNDVVKYDIAHSPTINIVLLRLGQNLRFVGAGMTMVAIRVLLATNVVPNLLQYKI
jgi:hypothetical protein